MRALLIVILALSARQAEADCHRTCPAVDKNEYGCCPTLAPRKAPAAPPRTPAKPSKPLDPKHLEGRKQAEALEAEGKRANDPSKFVACGQRYFDLYNADPQAADSDEILWSAGMCFEQGRSLGAAIQSYNVLLKYYPQSTLSIRALGRLGNVYASITFYDRAAQHLEDYAAKVPADAFEALGDAAYYRRGIGDDAKAIENTKKFVRLFGVKRPLDAAGAHFNLISIYEKQGPDAALAHLRDYVRTYGEKGGADRLITAHAKIGEILWAQACPTRAIDGVCARIVRELAPIPNARRPKAAVTRCGPNSVPKFEILPRNGALAKDALASFKAAIALYDKSAGKVGGFEAGARHFYAVAKIGLVDVELEKFLQLPFPAGLDFDAANQTAYKDSVKKLGAWWQQQAKASTALRDRYEAVVKLGDPRGIVEATAKFARSALHLSWTMMSTEIPKSVQNSPRADDATEAFCDAIVEKAEPLVELATKTLVSCATQASQLAVIDDWSGVCERELQQLQPMQYPALLEQLARPTQVRPTPELAPPIAAGTGALATALAEFTRFDGKWNATACTSVAAKFAAIADPQAHYMEGLTHHRCGDTGKAGVAYQKALAKNRAHVGALVNLGALYHAVGKLGEAQQLWETATKADGKDYAARVNNAIVTYAKLVMLPASDRNAKLLAEDARFQLANAIGANPDRAKAYALIALVYLHDWERNRNVLDLARMLLDEAKRIDPKDPATHNVYGVLAIHRRTPTAAIDSFKAAGSDPDATFNYGLLMITLRKWADARKAIESIATKSYAHQLALGVVARGEKRYEDAEARYKLAGTLAPNLAEPSFNLGILYKDHLGATADLDKAIVYYRKAKEHFSAVSSKPSVSQDLVLEARAQSAVCDKTIVQLEAFQRAQKAPPKP